MVGLIPGQVPATTDFPGVAAIYDFQGLFVGSATLLPSGRHLLTAAHILPYDPIPTVNTWTAVFSDPLESYQFTYSGDPDNDVWIHPGYSFAFPDSRGYDLAIIDLDTELTRESYDIYRGSNEFTEDDRSTGIVDFVGYGVTNHPIEQCDSHQRGAGIKRHGQNRIEAFFDQVAAILGSYEPEEIGPATSQLVFDFDNGLEANDAFGWLYNNDPFHEDPTGVGALERGNGWGDSGGPNLLNGEIVGVTSFVIRENHGLDTDLCNGGVPGAPGQAFVSARVSYHEHQNWIDSLFPPKVTGVTVAAVAPGSNSEHADYSVPSGFDPVSGKAQQLQTVPIAQANQIAFKFNKPVRETAANLIVEGIHGIAYQASNPQYDDDTMTVTWDITPPLAYDGVPDQVEFKLTGITDLSIPPMALDGNWDNPESLYDTAVSAFPSGNWKDDVGVPGEPDPDDFVFHLNFVPADFNSDNVIDSGDFGNWNSNKFTSTGANGFKQGDANGDNFVDASDFGIWNIHKFTDWTVWRSPAGQMLAGGGGGAYGPSSSSGGGDWLAAYEALVERYRIFRDGSVNPELTQADWTRFADEVMALLGA